MNPVSSSPHPLNSCPKLCRTYQSTPGFSASGESPFLQQSVPCVHPHFSPESPARSCTSLLPTLRLFELEPPSTRVSCLRLISGFLLSASFESFHSQQHLVQAILAQGQQHEAWRDRWTEQWMAGKKTVERFSGQRSHQIDFEVFPLII